MGTCSVHLDALYISLYTSVYSDVARIICLDWCVPYDGGNVTKRMLIFMNRGSFKT